MMRVGLCQRRSGGSNEPPEPADNDEDDPGGGKKPPNASRHHPRSPAPEGNGSCRGKGEDENVHVEYRAHSVSVETHQ